MKPILWAVAAVVALSTLALGVAKHVSPAEDAAAASAATPGELAQLKARVARLESEVARLRHRRSGTPLESAANESGETAEDFDDEGSDGPANEERLQRRLARFGQRAELTDAQVKGLFELVRAERIQIAEHRASAGAAGAESEAKRPGEIQAIRRQTNERARELLDEQQFAMFEAMRARRRKPPAEHSPKLAAEP